MSGSELGCEIEVSAIDGDYGLRFLIRNPGTRRIEARYFTPYVDFDLAASIDGAPVTVLQPAFHSQARPAQLSLEPGAEACLETPIRLHFDPLMPPSGGKVPTRWTLRHAPAPAKLQVTLRLGSLSVGPCEALLVPRAAP